jgi:DNA polymerase-1
MARIIQNTQNVPRDARYKNLFLPLREGEMLLEGDLSQAEGMVVAWKAEEQTLIEKYEKGADVHSFVGTIVMGKPVTKDTKVERTVSKRIVHGSNYGMSKIKMSEVLLNEADIVIEPRECQKKQNVYFQNFPRIRSIYHAEIEKELRENLRQLSTPNGWKRKFFSPFGADLMKQAFAHYPQNVVAYVTNTGLIRLIAWGWSEYIYAQVHDSILMSVPVPKLPMAAKILKKAMTLAIPIKSRTLTIPVELKIGQRWGEMKDYHVE